MDEWVRHQDEAFAYARRHPDERVAELLRWTLGLAVGALLGDEAAYYVEESRPGGPMDMLLYAHLVDDLMRRRLLVASVLEGGAPPESGIVLLSDVPVPRARNVERALAFSSAHADARARGLLGLALPSAIRALRGERGKHESMRRLPEGDVDLLLHARLIARLANRSSRVLAIMAGDFTEDNPFDAALAELERPGTGTGTAAIERPR